MRRHEWSGTTDRAPAGMAPPAPPRPARGGRTALALLVALTTVLAFALPAQGVPPVDPYQDYVDPGCLEDPVEQPGVQEYRDMLLSRMGGENGGIFACSGYEHGEGRAFDWMMDAGTPEDVAKVDQVLNWLLATDADGNPHAMARRLGIGNIIWNHRSISLWTDSEKEWNDYECDGTPGGCHTNHVHFAFSWAGARRETSWFTTPDRPGDWYPGGSASAVLEFALSDDVTSNVNTRPKFRYGNTPMVPIVGDWDGDGTDTVSTYDPTTGQFLISNDPTTGTAQYTFMYGNPGAVPLVGDWDGDGADNVGVRMSHVFFLRTSAVGDPTETTHSVAYGDSGDAPIIGDWDGDGTDNVGIYRQSEGRFYLRTTANTDPTETTSVVWYGNPDAAPLIGDWNGDGTDNVGVRMGNVFFFRSESDQPESTVSIAYGNGSGNEAPVVGDWNGDGTDTQGMVFWP